MAAPNLNITQNQIKPYKFRDYPQKANGLSFWAFLLSIFVYISLFYFLDLSPSTLFNTTRFWFFISNTLIIIIAADSGAFSCSKKPDLYEDYLKRSRAINPSSFELQYRQVTKKIHPQEVGDVHPQEGKKEVVLHLENKPINTDLTLLQEHESHNPISTETFTEKVIQVDNNSTGQEKRMINDAAPVTNNENTIVLQSSETEKHQPIEEEKSSETEKRQPIEEENEFSRMSNEELNKRVEEFIQRFNRQIRLQAALRNSNHSIRRREGRDFHGV